MGKDLLLRFLLGGTAVMCSYLVTVISPWEILAGIFAAFPAVMLTAVLMVGIKSGAEKASCIAKGSVYGMMGGCICVLVVLGVLQSGGSWILSIVLGLVSWLISSSVISYLRLNMNLVRLRKEHK